MIALVDCNDFYCSCEQVFRPDLKYRPVVVLSNNDGCIIARNQLAKQCGIPMGAIYYQYKKVIQQKNVAVFSANSSLYEDMSRRIMMILQQFSSVVDVYSIDEAFLSFDGMRLKYNYRQYAQHIQSTIMKKLLEIGPLKVDAGH